MSALHLAARNGHSVVVLSLINAGIPVNTVVREREGEREGGEREGPGGEREGGKEGGGREGE